MVSFEAVAVSVRSNLISAAAASTGAEAVPERFSGSIGAF